MSEERKCKHCGKTRYSLSARRLCPDCAISRQLESAKQLREKSGPIYEKWIRGRQESAKRLLGIAEETDKE